jgi:hypothetical protein
MNVDLNDYLIIEFYQQLEISKCLLLYANLKYMLVVLTENDNDDFNNQRVIRII